MKIRPASKSVGAFVDDVNVKNLATSEFNTIRQALFETGVLFFRGQSLEPQDHIDFAERWGKINVNRFFTPVEGHPQVAQVLKEPDQEHNIGGGWHTDHSYDQVPAMGSILYALEVPPHGGDTMFAGVQAAYDALDGEIRAQISGLRALHGNEHVFGRQGIEYRDMKGRIGNPDAAGQSAVHPIALAHPETGRVGIYVNPGFTTGIEGMDDTAAQDLLSSLYAHIMKPEFTYRFEWEPGSIAMWDNRSTWHWALNDYHGHRRLMHRITIEGVALQ